MRTIEIKQFTRTEKGWGNWTLYWCAENLKDEKGNIYFTWPEAMREADRQGLRLPIAADFEGLMYNGKYFDNFSDGWWLGKDCELKEDSTQSIFLPMSGTLSYEDTKDVGHRGYYWTNTKFGSLDSDWAKYLALDNMSIDTKELFIGNKFTVRCIRK